MIILRVKVRNSTSMKLIIRDTTYEIFRTCIFLPIQKAKTANRYTKIQRIIHTPNIPGGNDRYRMKPNYY